MPPYVHKVPATPPFQAAAALRALNVTSAALRVAGLGNHNAFVDAAFARDHLSDPQVPDLDSLGFTTVTTVAQARKVANALRPLITAHLADGTFSHLAPDTTSAAITAPLADDNGVGNYTAIGAGNAGVKYAPNQSGVRVRHVDPGAATPASLVGVSGKDITVTLKNTTGGAIDATATEVRAAVLASVAAMALLTDVGLVGNGSGTAVAAGYTALDATSAQRALLNQEKATVNTHYARAPEHNTLPGTPLNIAAADATDDATTIALGDALLQTFIKHVYSVSLTLQADPVSP